MHRPMDGSITERIANLHKALERTDVLTTNLHHRDDLAAAIAELEYVRELAQNTQTQVTAAARQAGASWTAIGRELGVSPQAVQQRWAAFMDPGSTVDR